MNRFHNTYISIN